MTDNNWRQLASCAPEEVKIDFYSSNKDEKDKAKALCRECPVRMICLQEALDNRERFGIHGGVDEIELRRDQAINASGEAFVSSLGPIRCPNCGPRSTKYLYATDRKRTRSHIICNNCGLKWSARKHINKKQSNF